MPIPVIGNSWEVNFSLISASVCSQMTFNFFGDKFWYLARVLKHAESLAALNSETHLQVFIESVWWK